MVTYFVPVPVPELPVPVLPVLPDPVLPALGTEPEDEEPGNVLGEVVVEPLDEPMPLAPEPALEPCCFRQSSRCMPVRPTHWLGVAVPDAPLAALPESLPVVVEPEVPPTVEPVLPALPEVVEALPTLEPVEPDVPALEPDDWARAAVERARSAAAVAAVMVFNIMF